MTLYELTRKLVARGCPEPDGLLPIGPISGMWEWRSRRVPLGVPTFPDANVEFWNVCEEQHARAIWTMHALEWFRVKKDRCVTITDYRSDHVFASNGGYGDGCSGANSILEAIEAATRHLEKP